MSNPVTPRIQFGDDINPIKPSGTTAYNTSVKNPSLSEKADSYDVEEAQRNIADVDLNRQKKQVCSASEFIRFENYIMHSRTSV